MKGRHRDSEPKTEVDISPELLKLVECLNYTFNFIGLVLSAIYVLNYFLRTVLRIFKYYESFYFK